MHPIVTRGLTKRFGTLTAVDELDLEVHQGEVFGFLGPNGSGKTTTIRLLLDLLRPTAGDATVLGAPVGDVGARRRIGFLPAELHLDRRHRVAESISFHLALRGLQLDAGVMSMVDRLDLDVSRRIGELSTGNRRKVGAVIAFAGSPELLILDEPTSGLDPLLQHEVLTIIEERVEAGAAVLLSSHVLPEVERVANRIGVIRAGQMALLGPVTELRAQAHRRIDLELSASVDVRVDELHGVVASHRSGRRLTVTVEGSVDPVLRQILAVTGIEAIVTHEPSLEDTFREVYR